MNAFKPPSMLVAVLFTIAAVCSLMSFVLKAAGGRSGGLVILMLITAGLTAFAAICRNGAESASRTILAPVFSSPDSFRLSRDFALRTSATPPPGTARCPETKSRSRPTRLSRVPLDTAPA